MWRKLAVFVYLILLGISWLQLTWFFGYPSVGGFVLTPSAHPYIPPLSLVITVPSNTCEGWAVKLVKANFYGVDMYLPVVHYFTKAGSITYEVFNYYQFGDVVGYFRALLFPQWAAVPYNGTCVAKVVFIIPTAVVILITIIALTTRLYLGLKRIW